MRPRPQLNQSELETLFDLSLDLLCIANVSGFFHRVNPAFISVLGYEEEELLDRPFIDFVHPDDREATLTALNELSVGKTVVAFENRYRCKNGEFKTLQWNAAPDRQSDFIAATARDVSVERALRSVVENSRELRALGTVATTIAHDMNNLLTPIINMSELLLKIEGSDSEQADFAANLILSNAERGVDLVDQILSFSENKQTSITEVQLEYIINDVIRAMDADVKTIIDVEPGVYLVRGNETQLFQVIMNLCQNATQAVQAGGVIRINLFRKDSLSLNDSIPSSGEKFVVLEVINDGPAIPQEIRQRIFEPFFTTRKSDGAHGLGLAIVFKIVKTYGGTVSVSCDSGKTKFAVTLPATIE